MTRLKHNYLGNIAKPWNSASAGQSWNTILSFYHSRCETDASHTTLEPGKHQLLPILNMYFPKEYHTPGPPCQRASGIFPRMNENSICPPLLGALLFLTVGAEGLEYDIPLGSTYSKWAKVDVFPAQASREKHLFRIYCDRMIEKCSNFALPKQNFRPLQYSRDNRVRVESCMFGDRWSFLPSLFLRMVRGRKSKGKKTERLQNHPETEKRGQWTSNVWFNSFIFFNIHFKSLRLGYLCLYTWPDFSQKRLYRENRKVIRKHRQTSQKKE